MKGNHVSPSPPPLGGTFGSLREEEPGVHKVEGGAVQVTLRVSSAALCTGLQSAELVKCIQFQDSPIMNRVIYQPLCVVGRRLPILKLRNSIDILALKGRQRDSATDSGHAGLPWNATDR